MNKPLIYLAGPISGLSYDGAVGWREHAASKLHDLGIATASPMRWKEYLARESSITDVYHAHPLSTEQGINIRDHYDVARCDAVLVNFLGATEPSIGTCIEIGAAHALRKPIVIAMDKRRNAYDQIAERAVEIKNPHDHAMVRWAGLVVHDLESAIDCVAAIVGTDRVARPTTANDVARRLLVEAGMD